MSNYSDTDLARITRDSGYFDPEYYKSHVHLDWNRNDPLTHFLNNWRDNLVSPSRDFCLCRYMAAYPDVALSGLNPLIHYMTIGKEEKRRVYSEDEEFNRDEIFSGLSFVEKRPWRLRCSHNRIAIYAAYNKDYVIEPYVVYFLEQLSEVVDGIIFVADNYFPFTELLKIRHLLCICHCQFHGERDFGLYKVGLRLAMEENMTAKANELIMCNDSFYGPVYDFQELYATMTAGNADFWGITHSFAHKEHIQSYYYNFNKKVFQSEDFIDFFNNVKRENNIRSVVLNYEVELTLYLARRGFSYSTLQHISKLFCINERKPDENPYTHVCEIVENGAPFIKRKCLTQPFTDNRDGLFRMFATLSRHSPGLGNLMLEDNTKCRGELSTSEPCFSIILPISEKDCEPFNTIDSILAQTWSCYELIIVISGDDAGLSVKLHEDYKTEFSSGRFSIVSAPQMATVGLMYNVGMRSAKYDWLCFARTNITIDFKFLEYMALAVRQQPECLFVYGQYHLNGNLRRRYGRRGIKNDEEALGETHLCASVIHAELVNKVGAFNELLPSLEDLEFLNRCAVETDAYFVACPLIDVDAPLEKDYNSDAHVAVRRLIRASRGEVPKISTIIIASGDGERLARAIDSALMQGGDFCHEILLVDDDADAYSSEIMRSYLEEYPFHVRLAGSLSSAKGADNMAAILENVKSDYLCFLDVKDKWLAPDKISQQLFFLQTHASCQLCFSGSWLFDETTGMCMEPDDQAMLPALVDGDELLRRHNPVVTRSAIMIRSFLLRALSRKAIFVVSDIPCIAFFCANFGPLGFLGEKHISHLVSNHGILTPDERIVEIQNAVEARAKILPFCGAGLAALLAQDISRLDGELKALGGSR